MTEIIIKECFRGSDGRVTYHLSTNGYGRSYAKIIYLANELQGDLGYVDPDEIMIVIYGGDRIRGIMGIEYSLRSGDLHPAYTEIERIERTL